MRLPPEQLSDLDKEIIDILRQDGRTTIRSLAEQVGVPETTARDRVHRLEETGVILGYRSIIDHQKAGFPIMALALIDVPDDHLSQFRDHMASTPTIISCNEITHRPGGFAIKLAARSTERLTHAINQWQKRFEVNVRSVSTLDPLRPTPVGLDEVERERSMLGILRSAG